MGALVCDRRRLERDQRGPNTCPPASRIRSQRRAEFNTFFATHTAGVYQRVTTVTPAPELRFSVWVWSVVATFEDERQRRPERGDGQVGIDPTGGTTRKARMSSGRRASNFDQFRDVRRGDRIGPAVTVFVRSEVENFVGTNNIYLDDASAPGGPGPPTAVRRPVPTCAAVADAVPDRANAGRHAHAQPVAGVHRPADLHPDRPAATFGDAGCSALSHA